MSLPWSAPAPGTYHDAIVYGSGAAGLTCALSLAQQGAKVAHLEDKNAYVGGYAHGDGEQGFYWVPAHSRWPTGSACSRVRCSSAWGSRGASPWSRTVRTSSASSPTSARAARRPHRGGRRPRRPVPARAARHRSRVPGHGADGRGPRQGRALVPRRRPTRSRQGDRRAAGPVPEAVAERPDEPDGPGLEVSRPYLAEVPEPHPQGPARRAPDRPAGQGVPRACWPSGSAPPGQLSAAIAGVFLTHALRTMWMPAGGFGRLAETLRDMYLEAGGIVVVTGARRPAVARDARGRMASRRSRGGSSRPRRSSAPRTRGGSISRYPPSVSPRTLREKLPQLPTTPSFFQVQLGVDMDLIAVRDHNKGSGSRSRYPDLDKLDGAASRAVTSTGLRSTSMSPRSTSPTSRRPGWHRSSSSAPRRSSLGDLNWERDKSRSPTRSSAAPNRSSPACETTSSCAGSGRRWTWSATPATPTAPSPGGRWLPQMLSRQRPPQRTVVPGLYAAGQWTTPNAGLPWVMVSGYNTAGMVLRDALGRQDWQEYADPVGAHRVRHVTPGQPGRAGEPHGT